MDLSSSGIGRASAVELSHAGWNVVLVGRNAQALTDTVLLCSTNVGNLKCYGDVADEAFVLSVFQETVARFGRVDLLFNAS
jgi:NAD(P)-dependent dehydrogenase (short-subunit alcohol dehydrogenase family)